MSRPMCSKHGCGELAVWSLEVHLWAKGHKAGSHPPLVMQIPLVSCNTNRHELTLETVLDDLMKGHITTLCRQLGKADPDFGTAALVWDMLEAGNV